MDRVRKEVQIVLSDLSFQIIEVKLIYRKKMFALKSAFNRDNQLLKQLPPSFVPVKRKLLQQKTSKNYSSNSLEKMIKWCLNSPIKITFDWINSLIKGL